MTTLLLHELGCLIPVPRTLGFIENHHTFDWSFGVSKRLISEMMDVLDKPGYLSRCILFGHLIPRCLVSRKGFPKYIDQRPITRQKNCVLIRMAEYSSGSYVETRKSFPCAWNACYETNDFAIAFFCVFNKFIDPVSGTSQIFCISA